MALAGALVLGALLAAPVDRETLDWQPALALAQPWRAWSAVFVHYSTLHLIANLAGAALVGAVGQAAPLPARSALAWFVAWPLTQLGLLLQPGLLHYGGLSGVLHAGVAVAGVHLAWAGRSRQRTIGLAMLAVLALKVLGEAPWGAALRHPSGWDIAVAPLAHATGALSGVICAVLAEAWQRRQ
jgi:rhomboid family GlyGly-CTERM serine protease